MRKPLSLLLVVAAALAAIPGLATAIGPVEGGGRELNTFAETEVVELPRERRVPTAAHLELTSASINGAETPDLTGIQIELSRNLRLRTDAVPPGAPVGHGYASVELASPEAAATTTTGPMRLTLVRGVGGPRLLGTVRTPEVEYTIPFSIEPAAGAYGTKLVVRRMRRIVGKRVAEHPKCLGSPYTLSGVYGRISSLELTLGGELVRASCPAPAGAVQWRFPLARFELRYNGGGALRQTVNRGCLVAG